MSNAIAGKRFALGQTRFPSRLHVLNFFANINLLEDHHD